MSHDDELTPAERRALAALPQHEPSRLQEERTVRALQAQGLLRTPHARRPGLPWLVAALAAGAVLYLGGIATGQWLSHRQTSEMLSAMEQSHGREAAALVQQTGSAYTQAIAALSRVPAAADSQYVTQGREVALNALYSAANELVNLTPDDPVVVRILQALDRQDPDSSGAGNRRVIWF